MLLEQQWDDTNPGHEVHRKVQEQLRIPSNNSVLQFLRKEFSPETIWCIIKNFK